MSQEIVGPLTVTSVLGVQGGSVELGATLGATPETPYVDFHFGLGAAQDFNVRLINPANNHLDVVTEVGGPVLSIHADTVGIGTTSPAAKLVVNEPAGGAELRVDGLNGTVGLSLGADATQPWVGTRTNHALRLLTNNTEQVRVQADGRIGLGTTSPHTKLDVAGQGRFRSAPWTGVVPGVAGTVIGFDTGNAGGTGFLWSHTTAGVSTRLWLDGNPLIFAPAGTERLRIDGSGNVGIGTPSPNTKLDVAGGLQILTGSNPIRFTSNWIGFPSAVANGAEISNDTSLYKTLMIVGNYSAGMGRRVSVWDRLEVNGTFIATGNVGIGTSNPLQKLHVAGSFLRVDGAGGEQAYIGGDGFGNDVQLGSMNPNVQNVAVWNQSAGTRMKLFAADFIKVSDSRQKKNVRAISRALAQVTQLRGVIYEKHEQGTHHDGRDAGSHLGFIAQEVNAILPEVVSQDSKGMYGISYTSVIPLMVEAIKEQQQIILCLQEELEVIKRELPGTRDGPQTLENTKDQASGEHEP